MIALRFWNELTPDETARRLALTTGSVKSLQHRALAALRRVLEGKKGNDNDEL